MNGIQCFNSLCRYKNYSFIESNNDINNYIINNHVTNAVLNFLMDDTAHERTHHSMTFSYTSSIGWLRAESRSLATAISHLLNCCCKLIYETRPFCSISFLKTLQKLFPHYAVSTVRTLYILLSVSLWYFIMRQSDLRRKNLMTPSS